MLNITTENDDIFRAGANTKECVNGVNPGRPQIYTNVVHEPQRGMRK